MIYYWHNWRHGLDNNAVSFMRRYLTNRLQRCKINNSFSEWAKVFAEVPQGSILSPLIFNIFNNDILFLQKRGLANYADNTTSYTSDKHFSTIIDLPSQEVTILSKWFYNNFIVFNSDKRSFTSI